MLGFFTVGFVSGFARGNGDGGRANVVQRIHDWLFPPPAPVMGMPMPPIVMGEMCPPIEPPPVPEIVAADAPLPIEDK